MPERFHVFRLVSSLFRRVNLSVFERRLASSSLDSSVLVLRWQCSNF